jgi:hypothetical protein
MGTSPVDPIGSISAEDDGDAAQFILGFRVSVVDGEAYFDFVLYENRSCRADEHLASGAERDATFPAFAGTSAGRA